MRGYLLDTNILSEVMKSQPDKGVINLLDGLENVYISVLTIHEIYFGIECLNNSLRKQSLTNALEELTLTFENNLLSFGQEEAKVSATMRSTLQKNGRQLHLADSMIAATAFTHGLTILTRNIKDFKGLQITASNPFTS